MEAFIAIPALLIVILTVFVHVLFTVGLNRVAREDEQRGTGPLFVSVSTWTLATLVGGPFVTGLYWAMHHSTLRPRPVPAPQEPTP